MTRDEKWLLDEKYSGVANSAYETDVARLAAGEPLAYIIGTIPFLGLTIALDSRPLIPRPETEWWTEQMLKAETEASSAVVRLGLAARSATADDASVDARPYAVLDLCAGSGAIGCAMLARLPNAQVYFGEINPTHEQTILKNIHKNHLDAKRAEIRIGDLFTPFADMRFDLIAINPPYIPTARALPESVSHYEPAEALFSGEDGLALIRRIAQELPKHLTSNGSAWIECDSQYAEEALALFTGVGLLARLCNDQYDKPRIIVCRPTGARSTQ